MGKLIVVAVLSFLVGGAVAALASPPGTYFEGMADVRGHDEEFRNGYVAGIYDTVSGFARAAQAGSLNGPTTSSLFGCLDTKGDKLGQFRTWADSVWSKYSSNDSAVLALIDECLANR